MRVFLFLVFLLLLGVLYTDWQGYSEQERASKKFDEMFRRYEEEARSRLLSGSNMIGPVQSDLVVTCIYCAELPK